MLLKKLMLPVISAALFVGCGDESDDDKKEETASTTAITLTQAQEVVTKSCVASGCHASGSGNQSPDLTSITADSFKTAAIKGTLDGTGTTMPPAGSSQASSFSSADKQLLLDYINQE